MSELGEVAYRAYCESIDERIPGCGHTPWAELPPHAVKAWNEAGKAVAKKVYEVVNDIEPCPETLPAPPNYPWGGT